MTIYHSKSINYVPTLTNLSIESIIFSIVWTNIQLTLPIFKLPLVNLSVDNLLALIAFPIPLVLIVELTVKSLMVLHPFLSYSINCSHYYTRRNTPRFKIQPKPYVTTHVRQFMNTLGQLDDLNSLIPKVKVDNHVFDGRLDPSASLH